MKKVLITNVKSVRTGNNFNVLSTASFLLRMNFFFILNANTACVN